VALDLRVHFAQPGKLPADKQTIDWSFPVIESVLVLDKDN